MNNFKKQFIGFRAVNKLMLKTFLSQPIGIIITFILPFILEVVLTYIFYGISHNQNSKFEIHQTLSQLMPGLLNIPVISLSLIGIPFTFTLLKESSILKKIGVTNISPTTFIYSIIIVFFSLEVFSSTIIFLWSKIIWQDKAPNPHNAAFLIPYFLTALSCISIGILIGGIAKTSPTGFGAGVGVFMPLVFLSGAMFPAMYGWINIFAKVAPINAPIELFKLSWNYGVLTLQNKPPFFSSIIIISNFWDTLIAYLYPLLFASVAVTITLLTFNWK